MTRVMRVKQSDDKIDENSQVERYGAPERHSAREPVQHRHAAKLFLPFHLVVEEGGLLEEVCDFAALLVLLRGGEHSKL